MSYSYHYIKTNPLGVHQNVLTLGLDHIRLIFAQVYEMINTGITKNPHQTE